MNSIKLFLICLSVLVITDIIWLSFIAKHLYFQNYEPWLRLESGQLKPLWWAACIVYLLFALGIILFVFPLAHNSIYWAAFYGAILGAVIYGIYNFTCLAIFKDFPLGMGLLDWLWGTLLCSWASFLTVFFNGYLK